jgi:signal transduction histidine kinase
MSWRRPGPTPAERLHDLYLALLLTGWSLIGVTLNNSIGSFPVGPPPSWAEALAWSAAVPLPLIFRRRWPATVLAVVSVTFIAGQLRSSQDGIACSAALFAALYTLGAWGPDRRVANRMRVAVVVVMFSYLGVAIFLNAMDVQESHFPDAIGPLPPMLAAIVSTVLFNAMFFGAAYFFGNLAWTAAHREYELKVQAEELRRSQDAHTERAVIQERVRIARELHDVVAHHVSVMGVQAGACRRVMDRDPVKARTALTAVEQAARTAVDELRRMLGVLRQTDGTAPVDAAGHDVAHVEDLLRAARDAGLDVRSSVHGTPVDLPDSVSLAVYRVVQESLTNTLKHAKARSVDVRVRYLQREVEVDVADDGTGGRPGASGGLGLIGMRERVSAHDGVLEAGARKEGGFRVRATFPLTKREVPTPREPMADSGAVVA